MKRLTALIAFALTLGMASFAQAQAQRGRVFIPDLTAAPGETVTIPVRGDENLLNVGGVQFEVDFSSVSPAGQPNLEVVANTAGNPIIRNGTIIPTDPTLPSPFIAPTGVFHSPTNISGTVVGHPEVTNRNGPGDLAYFDVVVPAGAADGTVYSLSLVAPVPGQSGGTSVSDPLGTSIPIDLVGGTLTVERPPIPPAGTVSITSGAVQNNQVVVNIVADEALPRLGGIDLTLTYDPAVLTLPEDVLPRVTLGDLVAGGNFQANVLTPGTLKIAAVSGDDPSDAAGTIASVTFDIATGATGTTNIGLTVDDAVNTDGANVEPATVQGGTVTLAIATFTIGNLTLDLGQMGTVDVSLNDQAQGVAGATFVVSVGPGVTVASVTNGAIIGGTVEADVAPVEGQPGQFRVAIVGTTAGNGPGALASLSLMAGAEATGGQTPLTIVSAELRDIDGNVIPSAIGPSGVLTINVPAPTPAGTVAIQPVAASQGGTAVVNVTADADFQNVGGVELTLTYDPNVLSLPADANAAVTLGSILAGGNVQANVLTPGTLKIAALAGPDVRSGPGTLVSVAFIVAANAATGASNVGLTVDNAVSGGGNPIAPATVTPGAVTVGPFGDLNGNGQLDIEDIRLGIQLLFQATPDPARVAIVDVNANGRVDLKDLRILLRRVLNLPNP